MTTPAKPKPVPANYADFFSQVLAGLGIHGKTAAQAQLRLADVVHEEGANSYYNPFNIEYHPGDNTAYKGTGNFNSVGVQTYGSEAQGVAATIAYLKSNSNWNPLLNALQTGDKSKIDDAFSKIYTWADFKPGSLDDAHNILASIIGTHSVNVDSSESLGDAVGATVHQATHGITSIASLVEQFGKTDFWIRIGFIVLGLFILLIGVDKLTAGGITGNSNSTPTETIDVVTGNGNNKTTAGRVIGTPAKAVKHAASNSERGGKTIGTTAKTATKRVAETGVEA